VAFISSLQFSFPPCQSISSVIFELFQNLVRMFAKDFSRYNGRIPTCEQCGLSFPSLSTLDVHIKASHTDDGAARRQSQSNLSDQPIVSANEEGRFQCTECDTSTGTAYDLKLHMNLHTGKFRCDICEVNLRKQSSLDNHNKVSKPY
jgi:hypothetical protein